VKFDTVGDTVIKTVGDDMVENFSVSRSLLLKEGDVTYGDFDGLHHTYMIFI